MTLSSLVDSREVSEEHVISFYRVITWQN